jgi:hypothetical protein
MRSAANREARVRQLEQILAHGSPDPDRCAWLHFAMAKLYDAAVGIEPYILAYVRGCRRHTAADEGASCEHRAGEKILSQA